MKTSVVVAASIAMCTGIDYVKRSYNLIFVRIKCLLFRSNVTMKNLLLRKEIHVFRLLL